MTPSRDIARLIEIMAALRHPETGCPWDIVQDFQTIAPYTIEEAHEVAEAIARNDLVDLKDELGDLLLQVVYHARLAEEQGAFAFEDVVEAICTKMIRRHPHVFGDEAARSAGVAKGFWEAIKAEETKERRESRGEGEAAALLESVPTALPVMTRARKLQEKAAKVGFDWDDPRQVLAKIREEVDELEAEMDAAERDRQHLEDEVGDLAFSLINLARHLSVDTEQGLRRTNAKFVHRFGEVEATLKSDGRSLEEASLDEMEGIWVRAKENERGR